MVVEDAIHREPQDATVTTRPPAPTMSGFCAYGSTGHSYCRRPDCTCDCGLHNKPRETPDD